jgi:hypothetical protein
MFKHLTALIFTLTLLSGAAAAETRNLSGFERVRAADRLEVEIGIGPVFSVDVTGVDAARVRTRIVSRQLEISDGRRNWFGGGRKLDAVVRVTMPLVEGLAAARGAEMSATLSGACEDLSVAAAMGASIRARGIECASVDAAAAMGGEVQLVGTCRALSVAAAMGGEVRAGGLLCQTVDASAAMGGDVQAFASQSYDASASMGGAVNVAGQAAQRESSAAMGGAITSNPR